ncbi:MAG: ABC transporter permease [Bacteroidales bacterium]|jgi:lipoprotein-releasing system permease protein|nr:ABC transporter permease [Bacteroidales bacterium]
MRPEAFIASKIFSLSPDKVSTLVMRITLLSVTIGVAVMLISLAIVIGFKNQIRDKVIGFVAPIQIESLDHNESLQQSAISIDSVLITSILQINGVKSIQAVAEKAGIIKTEDQIQGVVLKGVDAAYNWSYFQSKIISGRLPDLQDDERSLEVLISKSLSDKLMLNIGDPLRMWFVSGNEKARGRKFVVSGIYETGLVEFDDRYVFGDLNQIRRLNNWNPNEAGSLEVLLHQNESAAAINESVYFSLPVNLTSYTAISSYPHVFDWLNLQDMNVIIIIALMVMVSGITVISLLLMMVIERTSMIGILKALGASNAMIRRLFLIHSVKLLIYGLLAGNFLGIGFAIFQQHTGFFKLPSESYYLSTVPIDLQLSSVLLVNLGAGMIWFLMLLIPSFIINGIKPASAIKFS